MNIFTEVKDRLTARQAAEYYGLKVGRNGLACCPFHDDRHPSMKIDRNYHCFACGVGGDAIDYVARMFGLSQLDAARKLIEDFGLPIPVTGGAELSRQEREHIRRAREERERIVRIRERFDKWCLRSIDRMKESQGVIERTERFLSGKPPDIVFCEDYARMLHAQPLIGYWLDILCMGNTEDKKVLFLKERKEVENLAGIVQTAGVGIMERSRGSA